MDPEPFSIFLIFSSINSVLLINTIVLIILLVCSALISGTEVAFFSLSQTDLDTLSENSKDESTVVKLLEKPKKLLATILITNNFINILIVLLFATIGETVFSNLDYNFRFILSRSTRSVFN